VKSVFLKMVSKAAKRQKCSFLDVDEALYFDLAEVWRAKSTKHSINLHPLVFARIPL